MSDGIEVFVSYARKDKALLQELEKHLLLLKRQGLIDIWHDRDISAGTKWENEIDKHINTAKIVLLLLSADFIASDRYYSYEMKRAMERHERGEVVVIPIILRPVDWYGTPFSMLHALPTGGKPIITWSDRDLAFLDVVQGIRRVVEVLTRESSIASIEAVTANATRISSTSKEIAGSSPENKRLVDLENTIRDSYSIIREYESIVRLSDDPREKWQALQSIDHQVNVIKDFLGEYMELANQLGVSVPIDIIQISANIDGTGGTGPKKDYNAIRNTLSTFSMRELRLLGLNLSIDLDTLPGEDRESKVIALLDYLRRRSRMDELVAYLQRKSPSLKFVS